MAKVKVNADGKAPKGLSAGDSVVTGGGTYKITGVNSDGSYKSEKVSNETTSTYKGSYDSPGGGNGSMVNKSSRGYANGGGSSRNTSPTVSNASSALSAAAASAVSGGGYGNGNTYKVGSDGKAPKGLSVGSDVVTGGGTYRIMGVNADGTYQSQKINNVTTGTYSGVYANAPYGGAQGLNLWASGGINGSDGQGGFAMYGNNEFQDANGHRYPGYLWTLQPDGTIKNKLNDEIRTYQPGDDRTGKTSLFYGQTRAYGPQGEMIMLTSDAEKDFIANAPAGSTTKMNGSTYVKNADGSVTITTGDEKIFRTDAGDDGTWAATPDRQNRAGHLARNTGFGGGGGASGGGVASGAAGGGASQMTAPAWQMPTGQGLQSAFSFAPYEETERGRQAQAGYQALLDRINKYPDFSYDPKTDPLYQQYADAYTRKGRLAMEDTLGQVAARTGGLASSYAEQTAQQTYDQYMAQLADKVPELRQLAYSMYMDDYNRELGLYDRGYRRYSDDYDRYMDQTRLGYDIYNNDRNFAYNAYRDQVGDDQWQQQFDWAKYTNDRDYARDVLTSDRAYNRDVVTSDRAYNADRADTAWNQNWQQTQFDYQKEQDARQLQLAERQYQDSLVSELLDRVERGYVPTQEDADRLGLTPTQLAQYQAWARERNRQENSKYYAYGGY